MKVLCTIKWDTEIVVSALPTYTNCLGKVYHVLDFEVEMSCTGGSLDFAVYHDGKRQGSKHVVVDYETRSETAAGLGNMHWEVPWWDLIPPQYLMAGRGWRGSLSTLATSSPEPEPVCSVALFDCQ
jgi:hypothetical protein